MNVTIEQSLNGLMHFQFQWINAFFQFQWINTFFQFQWINASSNFAISVHIDQDWDSNPEELIFVNFHEVTLFFNNEFAESVGVDPNTFHSTSCFQDSPGGRSSSFSNYALSFIVR